jgi:dihydroorotate dehydrogenase
MRSILHFNSNYDKSILDKIKKEKQTIGYYDLVDQDVNNIIDFAYRDFHKHIVVIGIGGICSAEDVLEFILVGASAVQVGTANFMRPDKIFQIIKDLPQKLSQLNITSWSQWRGKLKI